jgi:hypothetical protein
LSRAASARLNTAVALPTATATVTATVTVVPGALRNPRHPNRASRTRLVNMSKTFVVNLRSEPSWRNPVVNLTAAPAPEMIQNVTMSDAPKSAYELAMERLRKKDADEGVQHKPLTEARSAYEARVAERKIMHQSAVASIFDPAERAERDDELRRDLDRFERERDEKIGRIRAAE